MHRPGVALEHVSEMAGRLEAELGKAIIGQQRVIREILIAFLAGGHCLLRGVPGLAKTLLIKTLAECVNLKFNRIQFTPDLMPSDILGAEVIEEDRATGKRVIRFIQGPIFANIILADEINRTPPKTQAALLEAMQEYQVTVSGQRFTLERPLFVLATQNPIEQEGTYPLPEAQLDRFMFNIVIEYPSAEEERRILSATTGTAHAGRAAPWQTAPRSSACTRSCARCRPPRTSSITRHVSSVPPAPPSPRMTREAAKAGRPTTSRAGCAGARGRARARHSCSAPRRAALLDGRSVAAPEDVAAVALPVLRHRILVNFQAEADAIDADAIVGRLLADVRP